MSQFASDAKFSVYQKSIKERQYLVLLLKKLDLWKLIEQEATHFFDEYQQNGNDLLYAPIVITFYLDYLTLKNESEYFLHLILYETIEFERILNDVVYEAASVFLENVTNHAIIVSQKQIHCNLRMIGFSALSNEDSVKCNFQQEGTQQNLKIVRGSLSGFGQVQKFVRQSVWYCTNGCIKNVMYKMQYEVPQCELCKKPMMEYIKLRNMSEYLTATILPMECVTTPRIMGKVFNDLKIQLYDDLATCVLKLGHEYIFTGVYKAHRQIFVAWDIMIAE